MKILKIFDGDYPWDVRVEKVTDSLLDAGHEVALVCRNRKGALRREQLPRGLQMFRIPETRIDFLSFPAFVNPLWVMTANEAASEFRPDVVLARDLPLAPLAIRVAQKIGVPVVADLAEPYPDSLRAHFQFQRPSLLDWVVRNPTLADLVEKWVVKRIDHAIVVCPEAGERLVGRGLPQERWTEVQNTAVLDRFVRKYEQPDELAGLDGRTILLFSGLLAGDRGLDTAIDALALLKRSEPGTYALVVVGQGPVESELRSRAERMGLQEDVRFTGWVPYERLPDIIAGAHVGLLPFHSCPHIEASLANKLFEYMAHGLPVIASDIAPMTRIIQRAETGEVFPPADHVALAARIEQLTSDEGLRASLVENSLKAARQHYNWDVDGGRLLGVIADVCRNRA